MTACRVNQNIEIISALINVTNDINLSTKYGDTALHFACENCNYEAIKLLLKHGADFNITNTDNKTAYELADDEGKRIIDDFTLT